MWEPAHPGAVRRRPSRWCSGPRCLWLAACGLIKKEARLLLLFLPVLLIPPLLEHKVEHLLLVRLFMIRRAA